MPSPRLQVREGVQTDKYPSAMSPKLERSVQTEQVLKLVLTRDSLKTQGQTAYQTDHKNPLMFCLGFYNLSHSLLSLHLTFQYHQLCVSTTSSKEGRARGSHTPGPGNDFISSTSSGKNKNKPKSPVLRNCGSVIHGS